jgi:hypothetical protein
MYRLHWLLVVILVPACAPNDPPTSLDPPESGAQEPTTLTRVLAIADDGGRTETQAPVPRSRLVGRYFTGDGTGFNLKLDLRADGSFDLTWTGCLGVYGTASGTWALDPDGVSTTTAKADGLLATRPLDRLRVANLGGHYLLVQESSRDLFDEFGPAIGIVGATARPEPNSLPHRIWPARNDRVMKGRRGAEQVGDLPPTSASKDQTDIDECVSKRFKPHTRSVAALRS